MERYIKNREIIVITKDNFPNYIIEKFNKGNISIQQFSDIIRVYLMYNYGGI